MSNFFSALEHLGRQSVTQPFKSIKEAAHGDFKGGFNDLFHSASKAGQDVAHSVGIRGWVGSHPMQSVAALVATIFGGWAAWGAYGAGAAGGATGAAAGSGAAAGGATAGGGSIAAGTVIGQTVPATPGMIAAANGGGAAIGTGANAVSAAYATTATPSLQILAGSGYGVGGSYATTLGGEAQIGNTGFSTSGSWTDKAKDIYNTYNRVNQATKSMSQQQNQDQSWRGVPFQNNPSYEKAAISSAQSETPTIPTTTTQFLNGIDINSNLNNGPFTTSGTFGGLT